MSKHSLTTGKELITALKMLGEGLGYKVETEFPISKQKPNPQAIDVAWMRDDEQAFPLMVFEVESTASNAAANNPLKLYSKRFFEKPLFFFHVFAEAGKESSRLQDLLEQYGRMNYRTYTIRDDGPEPLLKDVLTQHRRLTNQLDAVAFVGAIRDSCFAPTDCHTVLAHAESLGFNKARGTTLPSYAALGSEDSSFCQDFYRYLTARRRGDMKRETDRYPSYFGNTWTSPLHLGILSSLQPEPSSPAYFDLFRRWHEEPGVPALRVGSSFGLNAEFDDFLAYFSAPFFALLAALMADVSGSAGYMADQLSQVFAEVQPDLIAVRSHIALWMLHLFSTDPAAISAFEDLRVSVNSEGGIAEGFLAQPYCGVPFAHLDPETDKAFHISRVPVPTFSEFRNRFRSTVDPDGRRLQAVRLAMQLLSSDETMASLGSELVPLLHAQSSGREETT